MEERDRVLAKWSSLLNSVEGFARVSFYSVEDFFEGFRFKRLLFFVEGVEPIGFRYVQAVEPPRPRAVGCEKGMLVLEDGYARAYTLIELPFGLPEAWPLELQGVADELHLFVKAIDPARARGILDRMLARLRSVSMGSLTWQLEALRYKLEQLQQLVSSGQARVAKIAVVLVVRGESRSEARERGRLLERLLAARAVKAASGPCFYQRRLYGLEPEPPVYHFIDTLSAKALYPFVEEELRDMDGFYLGRNLATWEPVIINPYMRSNYITVVLGKTGAGKSMAVKIYARRYWAAGLGRRLVIIDPSGEYLRVKDYIATGLQGYDISREAAEKRGGLGLDPVRLYHSRVIDLDDAVGVLADYYRVPEELTGYLVEAVDESRDVFELMEYVERQGVGLEKYLKPAAGADAWIYRGDPPIPSGRGAIYSFAEIRGKRTRALVSGVMALILASALRERGLLVVDEGWMYAKHMPSLMSLFDEVARTGRKYGINFVFASQRPKDLLGSRHGESILSQAATVLILLLKPEDIDAIDKIYNMTPEEKETLQGDEPGTGVLRVEGGWRLRVRIEPTQEELRVFSTRPGEW